MSREEARELLQSLNTWMDPYCRDAEYEADLDTLIQYEKVSVKGENSLPSFIDS